MTENQPEPNAPDSLTGVPAPPEIIEKGESIRGSAEAIGLIPGEGYEPPLMALDSLEPTSDE